VNYTVLFLCPHNSAKGVIAAAYFQRIANRRGLAFVADSAGIEPDNAMNPTVVALLKNEGIDVSAYVPRPVTRADLDSAHTVITMGCDVDDQVPAGVRVEHWDDVPPVSVDAPVSANKIRQKVSALAESLSAHQKEM